MKVLDIFQSDSARRAWSPGAVFFKMISEWRDSLESTQSEEDGVHALAVALRQVHRNDMAQLVLI